MTYSIGHQIYSISKYKIFVGVGLDSENMDFRRQNGELDPDHLYQS